jgi:hypothetical protein
MAKLPIAIGLSLCEQVVIEEKTHNATLVNCFGHRLAVKLPSDPIPFTVFALLTDGLGSVRLEVVVDRLDTAEEVYRRAFNAQFPAALATMQFIFHVRDCSFPVAGGYQVTLLADGQFVAQRKLKIRKKK